MNAHQPIKMLKTLTSKKPTLGDMFPNMVKLLKVHGSLNISTAAVERVFSKVKVIVTEHRNRLKIETTNTHLVIYLDTEQESDMDFKQVD